MKSCAFFGHRDIYEKGLFERVTKILIELIENEGFTQFYSGGRGAFDSCCAEAVSKLRKRYPQIKNTLVFSYLPPPNQKYELSHIFTDSVYLLEKRVPPPYAILETNKALVDKADCLLVAIKYSFGGAWKAVEYAKRRGKRIINVCDFEH